MKSNKRELILLVILIVLGAGLAIYRFVYVSQKYEMVKLESELKANTEKFTTLKVKQDEVEKYIQSSWKLDTDIRAVERKAPFIKDMPGMLVELYYMIVEHHLEGNDVSFGNIIEGEKYNYFNVSFEVKGQKDDINDFLLKLENFKREISIAGISFISDGQEVFNVKLNMKVYLLKDAEGHKEPDDYDFMEGKYGTFKDLYEMFR